MEIAEDCSKKGGEGKKGIRRVGAEEEGGVESEQITSRSPGRIIGVNVGPKGKSQ